MPQMAPIMWAPLFFVFLSLVALMLMSLFFQKKSALSIKLSSAGYKPNLWLW